MSRVSADEVEALRRELNIQKTLKHDNIVKLYNAFENKGFLYIILEYVENGNLFEYMKTHKLSEDDIVRIFYQMASAINYLHKQKILHRDIKPENILMKERGHAKLCDFGFCAPYGNDVVRQTMCGTTEYLPPEIIGREDQNDKVDIWCLGVLLYEMTHSKTPFEGQNIHMLQFQQKRHAVAFKPELNSQLRTIIERCLEFEPQARPTAEQILSFPIFSQMRRDSARSDDRDKVRASDSNPEEHGPNNMHGRKNMEPITAHNNQSPISLQNNAMPAPNLYQQQPGGHYSPQQPQMQNIYASKQIQTPQGLPVRVDPSPARVIYKQDMFRKARGPDITHAEPRQSEPKIVKYSVTRITRDGTQITETRSTSQSHHSGELYSQGHIGTNGIRTVRVVAQNASVDKKVDSGNFYKALGTKYSHANTNMYAPGGKTYSGPNAFMARNIYSSPIEQHTAPGFYKASDRTIKTSYTPKEYKYSYNKPGPEKIPEHKLSYHISNGPYTYGGAYADNGVRRVANPTDGHLIRGVLNGSTNNGPIVYGSIGDKNRSHSSNNGNGGNTITTRIVRQK